MPYMDPMGYIYIYLHLTLEIDVDPFKAAWLGGIRGEW